MCIKEVHLYKKTYCTYNFLQVTHAESKEEDFYRRALHGHLQGCVLISTIEAKDPASVPQLFLSTDAGKAFDRVNWRFLKYNPNYRYVYASVC